MHEPMSCGADRTPQRLLLTPQERDAVNRGRWFAALSPSLRHDILRLGTLRRFEHGEMIVEQGELAQFWFTCASGAIRFRRSTPGGRQVTLAYVEPGIWVGEAEVLHRGPNTYDAHAHGSTTLLSVAEAVFRQLLREHPEFGEALLSLQARRMRYLYWMMEDMATLPLRARLAKHLLHLMRRFGPRNLQTAGEYPLGIFLVQDELAQLLGCSRQRVNVELKVMEREGLMRGGSRGLVILDPERLQTITHQEFADARAS